MVAVVVTQPMLFPWPGFFEQMMLADAYVYLDDAQFSKGSFTNRVQVLCGSGRCWMTIPLAGKGRFQPIRALSAADDGWRSRHRMLLAQSLRDAPFFHDAMAILDAVHAHSSLCDLLIASMEEPARYMGIGGQRRIERSSGMNIEGRSWRRVLDIVHEVAGDRYLTGHGAAGYLDHTAFESEGVRVEYMRYSLTSWPQPGGSFTPYVSILDLIARMGPKARHHLEPATMPWQAFLKHQATNPATVCEEISAERPLRLEEKCEVVFR